MTAKSTTTGILLALACLFILGVMPILAGARPPEVDGLSFALLLTGWQLLAALPLWAFEQLRKQPTAGAATLQQSRTRPTAQIWLFGLLTGAMFGLATYMYVIAARQAGPVSLIIALQAYPLFAMLLEALFLGTRKSALELLFTAALILSLVYLVTNGTFQITDISWWSAFALGIPVLWSIAHVMLRQLLISTPITPNQVTVSRLIISGLFLAAVYALFGPSGGLAAGVQSSAAMKAAAALGFAYYLELILWFYAMRHIAVSVASSITVPAPSITMAISVVVLKGEVATYQIVAMIVIALCLYGLLYASKKASASKG